MVAVLNVIKQSLITTLSVTMKTSSCFVLPDSMDKEIALVVNEFRTEVRSRGRLWRLCTLDETVGALRLRLLCV